jgi:hypothetical protein
MGRDAKFVYAQVRPPTRVTTGETQRGNQVRQTGVLMSRLNQGFILGGLPNLLHISAIKSNELNALLLAPLHSHRLTSSPRSLFLRSHSSFAHDIDDICSDKTVGGPMAVVGGEWRL